MTPEEFRDHRNVKIWNMLLIVAFLMIGAWMMDYVDDHVGFPNTVSVFDFFILTLAVFRLVRLVSHDAIFAFVREFFMRKIVTIWSSGERTISYAEEPRGLKHAVGTLLGCLWCTGVWISLFSTFVYFVFPQSWIIFAALAIAGLAGFFQIVANAVGWNAEHKKIIVQKEKENGSSPATCGM